MKIEGPAQLVRIYVCESVHWHGQSLVSAIVERAKREGLAGATVTRGVEGFGRGRQIHVASILRLTEDLPVEIELVDTFERIRRFLPILDDMVAHGLVTIQDCHVIRYTHAPKGSPA